MPLNLRAYFLVIPGVDEETLRLTVLIIFSFDGLITDTFLYLFGPWATTSTLECGLYVMLLPCEIGISLET